MKKAHWKNTDYLQPKHNDEAKREARIRIDYTRSQNLMNLLLLTNKRKNTKP